MTVRVLLSGHAAERYGAEVQAIDPNVELLAMHPDGNIVAADGTVVTGDGAVDIAWASVDLFTEGGRGAHFVRYATASPTLRWFHSAAAGTESRRYPALLERGVRISNTHVQSVPIAEFVLRAALDHFQGAALWRAAQQRREWQWRQFRELEGTTWLIIGFGAIGHDVAQRAKAFDARIIGVRRNPVGNEAAHEVIQPDRVFDVLPRADVIVLSAPSSPETHHLVDAEFLRHVRSDALLINVGRGALVDEAALLESLDRGVPCAAVLDVTEVEPLPADSPLWAHPSVTITPHNAALGDRTPDRAAGLFLRNLAGFLRNGRLCSEVTLEHLETLVARPVGQ